MNADQEIGLGMGWDEGIAVIAGIARDRKSKGKTYRGSTRMNADQERQNPTADERG